MNDSQKQTVQWFPGHMAKTRRLIKESLPFVDLVTEVVDARAPLSSSNPELGAIIGQKPRVVLLNKCDMADEGATARWLAAYRSRGIAALAVDCRTGSGLKAYLPLIRRELADVIRKNESRGMAGKPLRVMVVGIPNTGKSSFINRMAGRNRAAVADRPGVTRSNSWFAIGSGVELLDTPGVLWPKFDDKAVGDRLAFLGSVKDEVVDAEALAARLLVTLGDKYPDRLEARYRVTAGAGLEEIARRRGMLISGGEPDTLRAASTLLDEFRGGKLGRITLEEP